MAYDFTKLKILIVEDNQPMLDLTKSILATFGVVHVDGAKNGNEGFDKFCVNTYDLVIADWMMRPIDGIELTRRIRTDVRSPNSFVPVILMTGFSEKNRVIEARDAGVTEFLVKPFNTRDLYSRMLQIIEKPRQFVRADQYFGPDRRRSSKQYTGPYKRENDLSFDVGSSSKSESVFL
jgi:two-component system chemotaxis response regulator CheY